MKLFGFSRMKTINKVALRTLIHISYNNSVIDIKL